MKSQSFIILADAFALAPYQKIPGTITVFLTQAKMVIEIVYGLQSGREHNRQPRRTIHWANRGANSQMSNIELK